MTPEEFAKYTPLLIGWIESALQEAAPLARPVNECGFSRLSSYYSKETLRSTKVAVVDRLPLPPLTQMGLSGFQGFERGDYGGITYLDTFFVRRSDRTESLYFHELVHVIQWRLLGPEKFLAAYAAGLEQFGYFNSPLEAMAYQAQATFESSSVPFDAEKLVFDKLSGISVG
jgi:hypothetical protein